MPGTIFVVDDDTSFRRSLARLLRAIGYEAREFSSVAELVSGAIEGDDCMLVNYLIGQGQKVRDLLVDRGIDAPTVLMSGSDLEEVVSENGKQPCLVKPFTETQLRQAIEAALGLDEFYSKPDQT